MKYFGFVIPLVGLFSMQSPAVAGAWQGGAGERPDMTFGGITTETFGPSGICYR